MRTICILSAATSSLVILSSCSNTGNTVVQNNTPTAVTQEIEEIDTLNITGNYVSADYAERSKGYDWVAVIVSTRSDSSVTIKVRSRSDRKKPTCTLDAIAVKAKSGVYRVGLKEGNVLFTFSDSNLTISPEQPRDETAVYFYCSGGGSLAGVYTKLSESIDTAIIQTSAVNK